MQRLCLARILSPVISTAYGVAIHRQGAKALDHNKRVTFH